MSRTDDLQTRRDFVEHARERIRSALQAKGDEYDEVHEDTPRNLFPSSALIPRPEGEVVADLEEEFGKSEFMPSAMGFVVRTEGTTELTVDLGASLSVYHPVFPSHDELREFVSKYTQGHEPEIKLPPKYRRQEVQAQLTEVSIPLRPTSGFKEVPEATQAIQTQLASASETARSDPDLWAVAPGEKRVGKTRSFERSELRTEEAWQARIDECTRPVEPIWSAQVLHRVRRDEDGWLVEFLICNTTDARTPPWVEEEAFVGVDLTAQAQEDDLTPIELPEVEATNYRYDHTTWASGRNADTRVENEDGVVTVTTASVPEYVQKRVDYRDWHTSEGDELLLPFTSLAEDDGLRLLEELGERMGEYEEEWEQTAHEEAPGADDNPQAVQAGKQAFQREAQRFREGVELLRDPENKDLLTAFQLMNQAFLERFKQRSKVQRILRGETDEDEPSEEDHQWRLFQLVFIVSELRDLLRRDPERGPSGDPEPTVLWFPTGGGKTEAYLGLVLLHAFWDRLRGKPYGVTAIAKFPLRMLSIQQFSRVSAVFEHAERIRQEASELEGRRGDPFSVGYYAGSSNSLNLLDFPVSRDRHGKPTSWTNSFDAVRKDERRLEQAESDHRKVADCPVCTTEDGPGRIVTTFDQEKPGFRHECENCGHELNLHVTDTEVLRHLPTFVVGTIDKFARVATEQWGRTMFGQAEVQCPIHGYLIDAPYSDGERVLECPVLGCGEDLLPTPENVDASPGILIQDELHLLTESLGAFASHYETMLKETLRLMEQRGYGQGPWKIVGSTATIEGYERLVRQLYNEGDAVRFPVPGPTRSESFYVEESDEPQRYVLGVRSHGLSHVDTVMKVLLEYHKLATPLAEWPAGQDLPFVPDWLGDLPDDQRRSLARRYRTAVTYGIRKSEVAQVNTSYLQQLNPHLRRNGLPPFEQGRVRNLTGDSSVAQIQDFLDAMEKGDREDYVQALTATSIISHGVDLDDLNVMVFRGMPHTNGEYIQAMSRVGRADEVPALVVNVYNPNRERDSSHFESHTKHMELMEILLRHVPTTRFSQQALEKTVPGMVLHTVNYGEEDIVDLWKKTTIDGLATEVRDRIDEFKEAVKRRIGLQETPEPGSPLVKRQEEDIEREVERVRSKLQRRSQDPSESMYASDRLDALRSLRETDVPIKVYSQGKVRGGDR